MKRLALFCVLATAALADDASVHSAKGSARIQFGQNQESISFSAEQQADGTVTGTAHVNDISAGVMVRIDVNCLNVIGNVATISGIVTRSSDPSRVPVGDEGIFQVVDSGQGDGQRPPDFMSLANFFEVGVGSDCNAPGEFDLAPVENGNIQVR
jgi:hypothetical protein